MRAFKGLHYRSGDIWNRSAGRFAAQYPEVSVAIIHRHNYLISVDTLKSETGRPPLRSLKEALLATPEHLNHDIHHTAKDRVVGSGFHTRTSSRSRRGIELRRVYTPPARGKMAGEKVCLKWRRSLWLAVAIHEKKISIDHRWCSDCGRDTDNDYLSSVEVTIDRQ